MLASVPAFASFNFSKDPIYLPVAPQPNVMLLLDDSGSMADPPTGSIAGTPSKMASMQQVTKQAVTDNASKMRIGLFHFYSATGYSKLAGGKYSLPCGSGVTTLNTAIDGLSASYATPLASALYEISRYFRGLVPDNTLQNGSSAFASPIQYRCQKNFTVVLTDGMASAGIEYPGNSVPDGMLPPTNQAPTDTVTGNVTNPWGSGQALNAAQNSWDAFPDPKMSGDGAGYFPFLDDIAQFAFDIDMKTSTSAPSGTCPAGAPGQSAGTDCAGKSWQDNDAGSTGEFAQQNMTTYTIGFDAQNELLKDTPLTNRIAFSAADVDVANDVIHIPNHGLKTGDYIHFYSTGAATAVVSGMGQADPANTIPVASTSGILAGAALAYSNAGGADLQVYSSQTDTLTLTSNPPIASTFTASLSQIVNLANNTQLTATSTDNFLYQGASYTPSSVIPSTASSTIMLGATGSPLLVGQTFTYTYNSGSAATPLIGGNSYVVQSCGTTATLSTMAIRTTGSICPQNTAYYIHVALAATPFTIITLTSAGSGIQKVTYNAANSSANRTFYISSLNTATGSFCLSLTTNGSCLTILNAGSGTQSFDWNWTHTVLATSSTYYAIPVDSTHLKLALTQADALAATPVAVQIYNGGNASQTFTYALSNSVGGLYGYETDLEPDSTPNPVTESAARGKYCVVAVDANNFKLALSTPGNSVTCPATPTVVDITNAGNGGILSTGPGNSYHATDTAELSSSLNAVFNSIRATVNSGAALSGTTSNTNTANASSRIYQAAVDTNTWSSGLSSVAFSNGALATTSTWGTMDALIPTPRNILTYKRSTKTGISMLYANLDAAQQQAVSGSIFTNSVTGNNVINWLKGSSISGFRERSSNQMLGDILDAGMIYVGAADYGNSITTNGGSTYRAFVTAKNSWEPMLYAGANDGMMHGFRATDGHELFAFIPNGVYVDWNDNDNDGLLTTETADYKLFNLTQTTYSHHYFVNSTPAVQDAYINNAWRTVLVGGLGQGGRSIFALNVNGDSSIPFTSPARVMWEFGSWNDKEIGYTFGTPVIALVNDTSATGATRWVAIFGNGYDSASKKAQLFVVDLATGNLVKRLDTGAGNVSTPNGLSEPAVVTGPGKIVQYVYAGDLLGNIWKFDLSANTPASWQIAYAGQPFFSARDSMGHAQPITTGIALGTNPINNKTMIYAATGKFLEASDAIYQISTSLPHEHSVYGLEDDSTPVPLGTLNRASSKLVQQYFGSVAGSNYRTSSSDPVDYAGAQRGWYADLVEGMNYQGEMVANKPIVRDNRLVLSTVIPSGNDPCRTFSNYGEFMALDALTGGKIKRQGFFDLDGDGVVSPTERVIVGFPVTGFPRNPTILSTANSTTDNMIFSQTTRLGSVLTIGDFDDTDHDGTTNAVDDFPDNDAANTDADHDGLPDFWLQPNVYACSPAAVTCNELTLDTNPPPLILNSSFKGSSVREIISSP